MYCTTFFLQAFWLELCAAGYALDTSYTSANWFDQFSFFTVCFLTPYPTYAVQLDSRVISVSRPYCWVRELRQSNNSSPKWLH